MNGYSSPKTWRSILYVSALSYAGSNIFWLIVADLDAGEAPAYVSRKCRNVCRRELASILSRKFSGALRDDGNSRTSNCQTGASVSSMTSWIKARPSHR